MPVNQRIAKTGRHTEWIAAILRQHGGVHCTDGELINTSVDPIGQFEYKDPNGDEVEVTIKVRGGKGV